MNSEPQFSGDAGLPTSNIVPFSTTKGDDANSSRSDPPPVRNDEPIPSNYFEEADGMYFLEPDENDDVCPVWICSPLTVVGRCRRESGSGWGRVVKFIDLDGRTHQVILDETSLNGPPAALLRPLIDLGLQIDKTATALKRVAHLLAAWKPRQMIVRSPQTGWLDEDFDTFILADGSTLGCKNAVLERDAGSIGKAATTKGDFETWRNTVAAAAVGNPLLLLALSQAFVGPLLKILGLEGGGFHFRGIPGQGKTTLLLAAASVHGSSGYMQSWRTTDNALENIAACCNDGLLELDELHLVEPRVAGEIVYMLANGRGKERMTSGGKNASTKCWKLALLSSGEKSLEEHLASGGKTIQEGQEIRFVDIEADGRPYGAFDLLHGEIKSAIFAEKLQQAAASNYGHAGRKFVERLFANIDELGSSDGFINRFLKQVIKAHDLNAESQVRRVLKKFAVAALAGEMATTFGLTGWTKGEALKGIHGVAGTWIENREAIKRKDIDAALDQTRTYLSAHRDGFVKIGDAGSVDGWFDDARFYIRPDAWARIHDSVDPQQAARLHDAANMLKTNSGPTLQLKMGHAIPGRPKVYAVSTRILDA